MKVCRCSLPDVLLCQLPKYDLKYDFLFSSKEHRLYLGSSPSVSNSGIGPTILVSVGLMNVPMLIRGCELTKARCSMLLYLPLVTTCNRFNNHLDVKSPSINITEIFPWPSMCNLLGHC
jgi:hypothetical protein